MSQFFTSGGQSIRASASASVLPMNIQDRFPLGWTGLISFQSKGLLGVFSNTTVQKHQLYTFRLYQFSSVTQSYPTLCDSMNRSMPGLPAHYQPPSPPKPKSIESVMSSNHFILCCPLLLLPSVFPSIRAFSNESALPIRWPKYWSFSFNISPSSEPQD